jgi:hypothetical protein
LFFGYFVISSKNFLTIVFRSTYKGKRKSLFALRVLNLLINLIPPARRVNMTPKWIRTGLLLFLALLWGVTAAPASEITLTSSHEVTLQITPFPAGTPSYAPDSGNISTYIDWWAAYPAESNENYSSHGVAPGTLTHDASGGMWAKTATATINAPDLRNTSLSTTLVGWGPQPTGPGPGFGFIHQEAANSYEWSFTAPADGTYLAVVSDSYNINLQLHQGVGSPYPLYFLTAQSHFSISISYPGGVGNNSKTPLDYWNNTQPNFLDDINLVYSDTLVFGVIFPLASGETVRGAFNTSDFYDAASQVPLPSSLLLLGSGLVGVLALGRRKRRT